MKDEEIKHCVECGEAFWIGVEHDWGDILDHWASEHNHTETFWRVVGDAKTWTRCGSCGEMFHSPISAAHDGLTVRLYCDDCADNGLGDKVKGLLVEDVTGRYVLDHEVQSEGSP
jgi:hypothetical protein